MWGLVVLALSTSAALAQTVTGSVINATTGKPAAGAEVTLVEPLQGMAEVGTTKADAQGRFVIRPASAAQGPRLVKATKDGVSYFKMLPPGTDNADLQVYDAAKKVDAISTTVDVLRMQGSAGELQVTELYAVQNGSNPPLTLNGQNTYEIVLPEGAQLDSASAQGPNGQPIQSVPQPTNQKGHYAFNFPLKPGETRFQLAYRIPYNGTATFTPQLLHTPEHFVVMLPASMQWKPANAGSFQTMQDQPGINVQVASRPASGQAIAFTISGTGTIQEAQESAGGGATGGGGMGGGAAANDSRPGGGLGAPIDAPDPLERYRWWILGAFTVALCAGALYTLRKHGAPVTAGENASGVATIAAPVPHRPATSPTAQSSKDVLLAAVKDELFQLEIEKQKGLISVEEYEKNKAALDQTLTRALSRAETQKV
ncbi:MAG TPA: carboxypeptidase-like regulatory domain-containing protein [Terriglobales bacterium]